MKRKRPRAEQKRVSLRLPIERLELRTFLAAASNTLFFNPEPVNVQTNTSFSVTVDVDDATGKAVMNDMSVVTLAIASGPTGFSPVSAATSGGVAAFSDLSLTNPGKYTLTVTDGMDTSATSASFIVSSQVENKLAFIQPPISAPTSTLGTIQVAVENSGNAIVTNENPLITLAVAGGPTSGALGGTTSAVAVNGVATFRNVFLTTTGTYVLTATDGVDSAATTSSAFVWANQLNFIDEPESVTASQSIGSVTVEIEYSSTNVPPEQVVAADGSSVTLTIASGPAGATLSGDTTEALTNNSSGDGVATFSGLALAIPGTYVLTASDGNDEPAMSTSFTVSSNYTLSILSQFNSSNPNLLDPDGGLTFDSTSGNLYGATSDDGTDSVFEVDPAASTVAVLASFNGLAELAPNPGLAVDPTGDLFGTTPGGGAYGLGKVFEIPSGASSVEVLASFDGADGSDPAAGLLSNSSGDVFGTTESGGANGMGTVFEIAAGTSSIMMLASFNEASGFNPVAGVTLDGSGDLFGTTENGGADGMGTVFELEEKSHSITALASFNGVNGSQPVGAVIPDSSGDVFGTTESGGADMAGTLFEITKNASSLATLVSFNGPGASPAAGLSPDSHGDLFGTTGSTVFELAGGTTTLSYLASFNGVEGEVQGAVAPDSSGNIFGTMFGGYASNFEKGAVFELTTGNELPPFAIQSAAANSPPAGVHLVLGQPSYTASGGLGPVTVYIDDASGDLLTSDDSSVSLAITGSKGVSLRGITTAQDINGVATFYDLSVAKTGDYKLIATDSADSAVSLPTPVSRSVLGAAFGRVAFPTEAIPGAKWNATVPITIINEGERPFVGTVNVLLDADLGTTLDGDAVQLAKLATNVDLLSRESFIVDLKAARLPLMLEPGIYHLIAEVTAPAGFTNLTTATSKTLQVVPAQLAVTIDDSMLPATLAIGDSGTLSFTVTNQSTVAVGGIEVTLAPSSNGVTAGALTLDKMTISGNIPPGKSRKFRLKFRVPAITPGSYYPLLSVSVANSGITVAGTTQFMVN